MKTGFIVLAQVILLALHQDFVLSDGVIEIELVELENTYHKDHGNDCCDKWPWGTCRGQCDTRIKLCLGAFSDMKHRIPCNIASVESKEFDGTSSVKFPQDLGKGLTNPMKFPFKQYLPYLDITFTSYDEDTWPNSDDLIDVHSDLLVLQPGAIAHESKIKGRVSTLTFKTKIYCAAGFYGDDCSSKKP